MGRRKITNDYCRRCFRIDRFGRSARDHSRRRFIARDPHLQTVPQVIFAIIPTLGPGFLPVPGINE